MPARRVLPIAVLTALAALPSAAHAASVSSDGTTVTVQAATGELNRVTLLKDATGVVVADTGAALTAGAGCRLSSLKVICGPGPVKVGASLGDRDDTLTVSGSLPVTVDDGAGADTVTGGSGADLFLAASGADTYTGAGGSDTLDFSAAGDAVDVDLDGRIATLAGEPDSLADPIENVVGTAFADTLAGDGAANHLTGGEGDDTLDGRGGADVLTGGGGTDTVTYAARTAAVFVSLDGGTNDGESGERDAVSADVERLLGGAGGDALDAGAAPGAVTLDGADGDDRLTGGAFADALDGGSGDDTLRGNGGSDALTGQDGGDRLEGGADDDTLSGATGDDILNGGDGRDALAGGEDQDQLDGNAGDDVLGGDAGDDRLSGSAGADQLDGGTGDDHLAGGDDADVLRGGDGADQLGGDGGADVLAGDPGTDELWGGDGDDTLGGGADADVLHGDGGLDRLNGEAGDDRVGGGSGDDVLLAGLDAGADELAGDDGWDTADYSARTQAVRVSLDDQGGDGASGENDTVRGTVDTLVGGTAGDRLSGHDGPNVLDGGAGNDRLDGRGGDDRLLGQGGDDVIVGGDGLDTIFGAGGDDHLSARDGVPERLSCGLGKDFVTLGAGDVATGCERRSDPPPVSAVPGPDYDLPRNPKAIPTAPRVTGPTVPGRRAVMRADGTAAAPAAAPMVVKKMIWTANRLVRLRYVWGGGHGSFSDSGYDCSGAVSYVLHVGGLLGTPLVSGDLARYARPGVGRWVTWYANAGHVYMRVAGLRLDTSPVADPSGRRGPRWRPLDRGSQGFRIRHPAGL